MKREVKLGIFTIVIICCSWAGIRFLSGIDIFSRNIDYYVQYDEITGISSASSILIQGVKVGKVTEIILEPEKSDKVILKLSIKRRFKIPQDSKATIYSPGLMSSMAIGIDLGMSPTILQKGDVIEANVEPDIMSLAADKLTEVTDMLSSLGAELNVTISSINSLLNDNEGNIDSMLCNLNSISTDLATMLSSQSDNLESAIGGLAQFSTTLGDNAENIDNIITNLSTISDELSQANISSSLGGALAELNTALSTINNAEGSAGKLLQDESLYENLAAVSASLNELLIDMQANPKRYVHFSLFGSKEQ